MAVGGLDDPGALTGANWARLASELRIGRRLVVSLVEDVAASIDATLAEEVERLIGEVGSFPHKQPVIRTIRKAVRGTLRRL